MWRIQSPPRLAGLLKAALQQYAPELPLAALPGLGEQDKRNARLTETGGSMSPSTLRRLLRGEKGRIEEGGVRWLLALGKATGCEEEFRRVLSVPAFDQREESYRREAAALVERVRAGLPPGLERSREIVEALRQLRDRHQPKRPTGTGRKFRASDSALLLAEVRLLAPFVLAGRWWATHVERQWWELTAAEQRGYLRAWQTQQKILLKRPNDREQVERFPPDSYEASGWPVPPKAGGWQRSLPTPSGVGHLFWTGPEDSRLTARIDKARDVADTIERSRKEAVPLPSPTRSGRTSKRRKK